MAPKSVNHRAGWSFGREQFLNHLYDLPPHRRSIKITSVEEFIRAHGGMDGRLGAVFADQDVGGAVDVAFRDHGGYGETGGDAVTGRWADREASR